MKKIAIIGAGFSGLATAWHLLHLDSSLEVTLFDPQGYGGEASKMAAGLLHKYAGLHARLNRMGIEAESKTQELLKVAEKALGRSVILSQGILRIAMTKSQEQDYKLSSEQFSDVEWLDPQACQTIDPHLPHAPAILIHSGTAVDVEQYLLGLFLACLAKKAKLEKEKILSLASLQAYDQIIVAAGASICQLEELRKLKVYPLKGQLLLLKWPNNIPPLKISLVSQVYITMTRDPENCIVGATYEHEFSDGNPDIEKALRELMPKAEELYPPIKEAQLLDVKAGFRASTPSHMPLIGHVQDNIWVITGMGSRGLLYHAYFAEKLAQMILKHDPRNGS